MRNSDIVRLDILSRIVNLTRGNDAKYLPVNGPSNYWADYLSRSFLVEEKKERKTRTANVKLSPKLNSLITIEDSKTPLHQIISYDPDDRIREIAARLRTASYLKMAAYYNPDCLSLLYPCQTGHGFHYCPGEARFSEVLDDKYYTEVGNLNPDNRLSHINELCSPAIDKINISQATLPFILTPLICFSSRYFFSAPSQIFPFSPIETYFYLLARDTPPSWYILNNLDAKRLLTSTALLSVADLFVILNSL
ncbi:hypothetical protein P9112_005698 [Eukaryota sp. TZLM1-RC]